MKRWWLAIGICGVSVTLAAAAVPVCKRLTWHVPLAPRASKKLDHKPTPKTLAAWKAWDEAKTLREYDLACGPVATLDAELTAVLPPVLAPQWEDEELPEMEEIFIDTGDVAYGYYRGSETALLPLQPYFFGTGSAPAPPLAETSEPATFWLLLLGLPMVLLRKRAIPTYSQATK